MSWRGEVEDGTGWGGLVPTKAEREQDRRDAAFKVMREALLLIAGMDYGNGYAKGCADVARAALEKVKGST